MVSTRSLLMSPPLGVFTLTFHNVECLGKQCPQNDIHTLECDEGECCRMIHCEDSICQPLPDQEYLQIIPLHTDCPGIDCRLVFTIIDHSEEAWALLKRTKFIFYLTILGMFVDLYIGINLSRRLQGV